MNIEATLTNIERAVQKRAELLLEAAGEDLHRLRGEMIDLLDLAHGVSQHPAVTGVTTTTPPRTTPAAETTPADSLRAVQEGAGAVEPQDEASTTTPAPEAMPGA